MSVAARFSGTITWIEGNEFEQFETGNVIVRPDGDIAFDVDCGDPGFPFVYTVVLSSRGADYFDGQFTVGSGETRTTGTVNCRRYTGEAGIALAGAWIEDGHKHAWFAELFHLRRQKT